MFSQALLIDRIRVRHIPLDNEGGADVATETDRSRQELRRHTRARGRIARRRARRGAWPDGRQRRGQVHAGEDRGGQLPARPGQIRIDDREVDFHRPLDAQKAGIEVVYQDLALCDNLTAASNVFLGREPVRASGRWRCIDYRAMRQKSAELFAQLKSETRPRDLVRRMSGGQRQAVAIARTLLSNAKIVLMDEPTAAISVRQVAEVLDLIRRLRDRGISVVLISHRMPDVFAVSDRIAVLRRGRLVADKPTAASSPEEVTGLITGAIETA
jgi:simple sugar transport system ATP-binding protein